MKKIKLLSNSGILKPGRRKVRRTIGYIAVVLFTFFLSVLVYADEIGNTLPTASDSSFETEEDTKYSGTLTGSDFDGNPLSFLLVDNAQHGSVELAVDGTYDYTPSENYNGVDSFTFKVNDGNGDSNIATVTITVDSVNDSPTAENASFSTDEDDTLNEQLMGSDVENGSALTYILDSDVTNGSLTLDSDGSFSYIPDSDFYGSDSFTYTVSDGEAISGIATVTIDVVNSNDAPVFIAGADQQFLEDSGTHTITGWATGMSAGPSNESDQTLDFIVTTDNDALFETLPAIDATTGTLSFKAATNAFGVANVSVSLHDSADGTSVVQTFTITIDGINDAPSFTKGGNVTVNEDSGQYSQAWATNISKGNSAESAQNLTFVVTTNNDALFQNLPSIADDGTLGFLTNSDANGNATVTVYLTDNGGTANDGVDTTATVTFVIDIEPVNDAPTISGIAGQSMSEDETAKTVGFTVNDIDNEESLLTITAVSDNEGLIPKGNVIIAGSGTNRTVSFYPKANQYGTANVTLTVSDGEFFTQTEFRIDVASINDIPLISQVADQTINEDVSTGNIEFTVSDVETDYADLLVSAVSTNTTLFPEGRITLSGTTNKRYINLNPAANLSGTSDITLTVQDADGDIKSITFTVTVNAVNDLPTLNQPSNQTINEDNSTGILSITLGDVETDVNDITLEATSGNTNIIAAEGIELSGSGANHFIKITPLENANGRVQITLKATDGNGGVTTKTFFVNVNAVNDAPVIGVIEDVNIYEDETSSVFTFDISDVDNNEKALVVSATSSDDTIIDSNKGIILSESGELRSIVFTPEEDMYGSVTITLTITDGMATNTRTFNVNVINVNDAPEIEQIGNTYTDINSTTSWIPVGISDIDDDTSTLIMSASFDTEYISGVEFGGSGANRTFRVTTNGLTVAETVITITVTDVGLESASETFILQINSGGGGGTPTISYIMDQSTLEDAQSSYIYFNVDSTYDTVEVVSADENIIANDIDHIILENLGTSDGRTSYRVAFNPNLNANGLVSISVKASKTEGEVTSTIVRSFDMDVIPVNDIPEITGDSVINMTEDDTALFTNVVISDVDVGDILTITSVAGDQVLFPEGSIVQTSVDGGIQLSIQPAADKNGSTVITVTATDTSLETATKTIVVNVASVNDNPSVSSIDDITINEDTTSSSIPVTIDDVELKANDLVISATSDNQNLIKDSGISFGGTGENRTMTITPASNANTDIYGTADITVTVSDNEGGSTTRTFTVTVNPVNDPPSIGFVANQTIYEDNSVGPISYTIGDIDSDINSLLVSAASNNSSLIDHSGITLGGSGANQTITLTPKANAYGTATISIFVEDDLGSVSIRNFTLNVIAVNDAPVVTSVDTITFDEDTRAENIPITLSDLETAPGSLTYEIISGNQTILPTSGIELVSSEDGNLVINLDTALNQNGVLNLSVKVSDGEATTVKNIVVNVTPVNDAPTISSDPASIVDLVDQTINEDSSTGTIPFYVGDIEKAAGSLVVTASSSDTSLIAQSGIALGGTGANRNIKVTPLKDQSGQCTITVSVTDGNLTTTEDFLVTVNAVNDAPSFTKGGNQTVLEDSGAATATGWATGISKGPSNESDQTLEFEVTADNTDLFSVQPAVSATGELTFTPAADAYGVTTVTIRAKDYGGSVGAEDAYSASTTFTITITPVNDEPSFNLETDITLDEDTAGTYSAWVKDLYTGALNESSQTLTVHVTTDNDSLFSVLPSVDALTGDLSFTLADDANGAAELTFWVTDSGGTSNGGDDTSPSKTLTITVNSINDAPVVNNISKTINEDGTLSFVASDFNNKITDVDGDVINNIVIKSLPADGTFKLNGTDININDVIAISDAPNIIYTPDADWFGSTSFTWNVTDGSLVSENDATVNITVNSVNDVPSFTKGGNQTHTEDDGAISVSEWPSGISVGPANESAQTVSYVVTNDNNGLFDLQPAISSDGTLTYNLKANANGTATVTVRIKDSGGTSYGGVDTSAAQTFTITVTAVNDAPVVSNYTKSVNEDATLSFVSADFTGHSTEVDSGDQLDEIKITGLPTNGTLKLSGTNVSINDVVTAAQFANITFVPDADWYGSTSFTWSGSDGELYSVTDSTVTITVNAVNDVPSFTKGADQTNSEDAGAVTLVGWATGISTGPANESSQTVTFSITGNTNSGLFNVTPSVSSDGTLTYTLNGNANGTATITLRIQDNGGTANGGVSTSATQSFTITVTPLNDAPVLSNFTLTTLEDNTLSFTANDFTSHRTDVDTGDALDAIMITSLPENGTLKLGTDDVILNQVIVAADYADLTFVPAADWNGSTGFNWNGTDGDAYAVAESTITLNVTSVNDIPSFTKGSDQNHMEDDGAISVAGWATEISVGPANESAQTVSFSVTGNTNTDLFDVAPSVSSDGILTYTLKENAYGAATISLKIQDNGGTSNGGINISAAQTFTIMVSSINDAPVLSNFTKTINEDNDMTFAVSDFTGHYSDTENDEMAQIIITSLPSVGTFLLDGTPIEINEIIAADQLDKITFQPDNNWYGTTSFNWNAYDGTEWADTEKTVTITVDPVNDVPVNTVIPDFTGTLHVGNEVSALDGTWNDLIDTSVAGGTSNITFTYKWQVATDDAGSGAVYISGETGSTLDIVSAYAHKYIRLEVTATNDGIGSTYTQAVEYSVWKYISNNAPVVSDITKSVNEDTTLTFIETDFTDKYSDSDLDAMTQIKITTLPENGTLKYNGTAVTAGDIIPSGQFDKITFVPDTNWNGDTSFKWLGYDGADWSETAADVNITVNSVNDVPIADSISFTILEDSSKSGTITGSDTENSSLTYSLVDVATNGTAIINADGTYTYTPSLNYYGADSFTFRVYDGTDYSGSVTVNVTINPINDVPVNTVIPDITGILKVGNTATGDSGTWNDLIDTSVSGGTSNINYTYQWQVATDGTGTGASNISGATGTTLGLTNTYSHKYIRIKVTATNDGIGTDSTQATAYSTWRLVLDTAPVVADLSKTMNENATLTFAKSDFENHYSDADADTMTQIQITSLPDNGTLLFDGTPVSLNQVITSGQISKLTFQPDTDWYGNTSFKWNGYDGENWADASEDVLITVDYYEPRTIEGVVYDNETGEPIAGAVIEVSKDFDGDGDIDFYATMTTGADGKYAIVVPRKYLDYTVNITKPIKINNVIKQITFVQESKSENVSEEDVNTVIADITAGGMILLNQTDGNAVQFSSYVNFSIDIYDGDTLISPELTMDILNGSDDKGLYYISGLESGKEYEMKVIYTLPDGEEIVVGTTVLTINELGEMNISQTLIDPFGTITDSKSGALIEGANVKLYYADTQRNRDKGIIPGTLVELPAIIGFEPFDNGNPQTSDEFGKYAYMVFPYTDYYIVAEKDGYQKFTSGIISVEETIVSYDFKMTPKAAPATGDYTNFYIYIAAMILSIGAIIIIIVKRRKK